MQPEVTSIKNNAPEFLHQSPGQFETANKQILTSLKDILDRRFNVAVPVESQWSSCHCKLLIKKKR